MADLSKLKYPKGIYLGKAAHDSGSFARGQPVAIIQHYTAGGHLSIASTAGTRIRCRCNLLSIATAL
jgi:hypothetical protein